MTKVNVHEAKTTLSKLLDQVEKGEEVIIARAGKPVARLVAFVEEPKVKRRRELGFLKGQGWISEDWDASDVNGEFVEAFHEIDPLLSQALEDALAGEGSPPDETSAGQP